MSRRKKTFPCGHKGYGQICHRCIQEQSTWEAKKQEKNEWQSTFANDPIDLRNLPKNVVVKARSIWMDWPIIGIIANFMVKDLGTIALSSVFL